MTMRKRFAARIETCLLRIGTRKISAARVSGNWHIAHKDEGA